VATELYDDQKDLFNYTAVADREKKPSPSLGSDQNDRYGIRIGIDFLLATILLFVVILIFVYIFGVKQGKKSAQAELESLDGSSVSLQTYEFDESAGPAVTQVLRSQNESRPAIFSEEVTREEPRQEVVPPPVVQSQETLVENPWTIQLVTYTSDSMTERAIESLAKDGYDAFNIPSGKYSQICVGKFNSKQDAQIVLDKLKASGQYRDAYLRRMNR